ncbi:MAG: site-specific integrase [Bacteroidales bacterium]|nr:site-specific integrase [Bacteroidales bacterium]
MRILKIIHRDETKLQLDFDYDQVKINQIKQINGCTWSKTRKAWLLPDSLESIRRLKELFPKDELQFDNNVEAKVLTELKVKTNPPQAQSSVVIEVINRKILIRLPKNEADIHFIRTLRYFRWLNNERLWEVPDYPGNLDLIRDYFGNRITEVKVHDKIEIMQGSDHARSLQRNEVLMIKTRSGRVKILASFNPKLIAAIKEIPYSRWDAKNKWWTIPYSESFLNNVSAICEEQNLKVVSEEEAVGEVGVKRVSPLDIPNYRRVPESYTNKHIELRNSPNTIKNYVSAFEEFINYFYRLDIDSITEPQILEFLRYLITERRVSVSYQNIAINAIKFYYEKVLKGQRKFYFIDRPRKDITLPDVLNIEEITAMIKSADNIKHKLIIMFAYSSGLRLGELVRLKLGDIDRQRMQVRVEQGKGRKDRYTKLSEKILPVLDKYLEEYKPEELIFNGEKGKAYSERSVQELVKSIARKAGVTQNVTPKTLRHTFATHSLENGVDLRYIQSMMGHASSKTTEIYTHITTKGFENIKSPLDSLDI